MSDAEQRTVMVCQNCACLSRGSKALLEAFQASDLPEGVEIRATDCQGQCNMSPSVRVVPDEVWYVHVEPEDVPRIVQEHLHDGQRVQDKLNPRIHAYDYYGV